MKVGQAAAASWDTVLEKWKLIGSSLVLLVTVSAIFVGAGDRRWAQAGQAQENTKSLAALTYQSLRNDAEADKLPVQLLAEYCKAVRILKVKSSKCAE